MNNKKVEFIDRSTPWYLLPLEWIINTFSYKVKINNQPIIQNIIKCQVTLKNGIVGVAQFSDSYRFDDETGEFSMRRTGLKAYQERENGRMIVVKYPDAGTEAWSPEHYKNIAEWGEPKPSTCPHPFSVIAIKFCGLTLRYKEEKIST